MLLITGMFVIVPKIARINMPESMVYEAVFSERETGLMEIQKDTIEKLKKEIHYTHVLTGKKLKRIVKAKNNENR